MKSPILRMFAVLVIFAVFGPIVANLISPTVAVQYNQALPALLAALLYKGPVYALVIAIAVVVVARYVLGVRSLEKFKIELASQNNDSYAIILGFVALVVTTLLTVVWAG